MGNIENLKPWKPGQSGNLNGRAKSWVTLVKQMGYSKSQATDCARSLLSLSHTELLAHMENDISVFELIICKALAKDVKKGSLKNVSLIMDRIFGRPKQELDIDMDQEIKFTLNVGPIAPEPSPEEKILNAQARAGMMRTASVEEVEVIRDPVLPVKKQQEQQILMHDGHVVIVEDGRQFINRQGQKVEIFNKIPGAQQEKQSRWINGYYAGDSAYDSSQPEPF